MSSTFRPIHRLQQSKSPISRHPRWNWWSNTTHLFRLFQTTPYVLFSSIRYLNVTPYYHAQTLFPSLLFKLKFLNLIFIYPSFSFPISFFFNRSGISYGKLPRQKMDIFIPISAQNTKESTPKNLQDECLPVIIVFPGYSWNSTSICLPFIYI
ncbi:hypothetical protein AYI69_g1665 [Smittium culicis]|uniref:Uncharacterized protein n=1 Tax=Smittium culicis TaxID=133412 RepID=A0A1R1YPP9_9FUNG|nr:hypothetical protein AYI69_g1665 [Smittium culicis]